MGSQTSWCTILLIFSYFHSTLAQSNHNLSHDSLDSLLQHYAFQSLVLPTRTGTLYKASLPHNLSGIEVSIVRLRSGSLWNRGANFSGVSMPPRILEIPFVSRLAIVYQNLGNWSDSYYNVPGYSMVTPVIGFIAYNASDVSANHIVSKLNLSVMGNPISIQFPKVVLPKGSNSTLQCVSFGENGAYDLSEMTKDNVCITKNQGHFGVVVPSVEGKVEKKKKERLWKWLVIGFALGFVGLVVIGLIGVVIFKLVKVKKIGKMEKKADEGESFDTIWIGMSKMPSATVIRTQPVLEHEEIP